MNAPAEATIDGEGSGDSSDDGEDSVTVPVSSTRGKPTKRKKISKTAEKWKKGDLKVQDGGGLSTVLHDGEHKTPKDLFEMFWTNEFFKYIKDQSELYARQC